MPCSFNELAFSSLEAAANVVGVALRHSLSVGVLWDTLGAPAVIASGATMELAAVSYEMLALWGRSPMMTAIPIARRRKTTGQRQTRNPSRMIDEGVV
jgi:hypothetical protein